MYEFYQLFNPIATAETNLNVTDNKRSFHTLFDLKGPKTTQEKEEEEEGKLTHRRLDLIGNQSNNLNNKLNQNIKKPFVSDKKRRLDSNDSPHIVDDRNNQSERQTPPTIKESAALPLKVSLEWNRKMPDVEMIDLDGE